MTNWGWDKDRHNTWYNQWDYKTPRSYRERYGVDYNNNDDTERQEHITTNVLTVILVLIIVGMLWLQN
jgi:hypothetical protein